MDTIFGRGVFVLYINNFSKEYSKGKKAVDNISLTVNGGEIFGFIGHNGAGKTTLLKKIAEESLADNNLDTEESREVIDEFMKLFRSEH